MNAAKSAGDRRRSRTVKRLPKLSIAVASACHLILAARATTGMGSDHPPFECGGLALRRRCCSMPGGGPT